MTTSGDGVRVEFRNGDRRDYCIQISPGRALSDRDVEPWYGNVGPWPCGPTEAGEPQLVGKTAPAEFCTGVGGLQLPHQPRDLIGREIRAYQRMWGPELTNWRGYDGAQDHLLQPRAVFSNVPAEVKPDRTVRFSGIILPMKGQSLHEALKLGCPTHARVALARGLAIAHLMVLPALHELQMIHGDVHCRNTLIDSTIGIDGREIPHLFVIDFGNSTFLDNTTSPSMARMQGTDNHRRAHRAGDLRDERDDWFALGVALHVMLFNGQLPFVRSPDKRISYTERQAFAQDIFEGRPYDLKPLTQLSEAPSLGISDLNHLISRLLIIDPDELGDSINRLDLTDARRRIEAAMSDRFGQDSTEEPPLGTIPRLPPGGVRPNPGTVLSAPRNPRRPTGPPSRLRDLDSERAPGLPEVVVARLGELAAAMGQLRKHLRDEHLTGRKLLLYSSLALLPAVLGVSIVLLLKVFWFPRVPGIGPAWMAQHALRAAAVVAVVALLLTFGAVYRKSGIPGYLATFPVVGGLTLLGPAIWLGISAGTYYLIPQLDWPVGAWESTQTWTAVLLWLACSAALVAVHPVGRFALPARIGWRVAAGGVLVLTVSCGIAIKAKQVSDSKPVANAATECRSPYSPTVPSDRFCVGQLTGWRPAPPLTAADWAKVKHPAQPSLQLVATADSCLTASVSAADGTAGGPALSQASPNPVEHGKAKPILGWPDVAAGAVRGWLLLAPATTGRFTYYRTVGTPGTISATVVTVRVDESSCGDQGQAERTGLVRALLAGTNAVTNSCVDTWRFDSNQGSDPDLLALATHLCVTVPAGTSVSSAGFDRPTPGKDGLVLKLQRSGASPVFLGIERELATAPCTKSTSDGWCDVTFVSGLTGLLKRYTIGKTDVDVIIQPNVSSAVDVTDATKQFMAAVRQYVVLRG